MNILLLLLLSTVEESLRDGSVSVPRTVSPPIPYEGLFQDFVAGVTPRILVSIETDYERVCGQSLSASSPLFDRLFIFGPFVCAVCCTIRSWPNVDALEVLGRTAAGISRPRLTLASRLTTSSRVSMKPTILSRPVRSRTPRRLGAPLGSLQPRVDGDVSPLGVLPC